VNESRLNVIEEEDSSIEESHSNADNEEQDSVKSIASIQPYEKLTYSIYFKNV
jgi:hypothetical protein